MGNGLTSCTHGGELSFGIHKSYGGKGILPDNCPSVDLLPPTATAISYSTTASLSIDSNTTVAASSINIFDSNGMQPRRLTALMKSTAPSTDYTLCIIILNIFVNFVMFRICLHCNRRFVGKRSATLKLFLAADLLCRLCKK